MNKPFYILSIDGGGFRGLFAAHLLKRIEEAWQIDWRSRFRLLAGTSTGAILSAGLACGKTAVQLAEFYKTHGEAIFTPRLRIPVRPLKALHEPVLDAKISRRASMKYWAIQPWGKLKSHSFYFPLTLATAAYMSPNRNITTSSLEIPTCECRMLS